MANPNRVRLVRAKLKPIPICEICKVIDRKLFEYLDTLEIYASPQRVDVIDWECCGKIFSVKVMKVQAIGHEPQWFPVVALDLDEGIPN